MFTSSAVIEDGGALWMQGGTDKDLYAQSSTQIVRPGQPTVWGPDMTEETLGHCSATLGDNNVMVTGGRRRSNSFIGSDKTEVYSFTTQLWTRRADMNQRRLSHSCSTVWLDSSSDPLYGIIAYTVDNSSVLSVVVAGGKLLECLPCSIVSQTGTYLDDGGSRHPVNSVEVYLPWNNTWVGLPPLPDLGEGDGRLDLSPIMSLPSGGGGSDLCLLGGSSNDYNTGIATDVNTVWRLVWESTSQTYSWINTYVPALGKKLNPPIICKGLLIILQMQNFPMP